MNRISESNNGSGDFCPNCGRHYSSVKQVCTETSETNPCSKPYYLVSKRAAREAGAFDQETRGDN